MGDQHVNIRFEATLVDGVDHLSIGAFQGEERLQHESIPMTDRRRISEACAALSETFEQDRDELLDRANAVVEAATSQEPAPIVPAIRTQRFPLIDSAAFAAANYPIEWLVEGVLVKGQPAVFGGPKKVLKTSFIIDLAISLAALKLFLGFFRVLKKCVVAVVSGESGERPIQETARRICRSKQVALEDIDVHWGFRLPRLGEPESVRQMADVLREKEIEVVIIDPLYLCLFSGKGNGSATNLFDTGPLLMQVADACKDAGATLILVHHTKKMQRNFAEPIDLDDLAYSGISEFARQWVLISRRAPFEPGSGRHELWVTIGGSVGQAGRWAIDVDEGQLQTDFSGRHWNVEIQDSEVVKRQQSAAKTKASDGKMQKKRQRIIDVLKRYPDGETQSVLALESKVEKKDVKTILEELIEENVVTPTKVTKKFGNTGTKESPAFKLLDPGEPPEPTEPEPDEPISVDSEPLAIADRQPSNESGPIAETPPQSPEIQGVVLDQVSEGETLIAAPDPSPADADNGNVEAAADDGVAEPEQPSPPTPRRQRNSGRPKTVTQRSEKAAEWHDALSRADAPQCQDRRTIRRFSFRISWRLKMNFWGVDPMENDVARQWVNDCLWRHLIGVIDRTLNAYLDGLDDTDIEGSDGVDWTENIPEEAEAEACAALLVDATCATSALKYGTIDIRFGAKVRELWDVAIAVVDSLIEVEWWRSWPDEKSKLEMLNELKADLEMVKLHNKDLEMVEHRSDSSDPANIFVADNQPNGSESVAELQPESPENEAPIATPSPTADGE